MLSEHGLTPRDVAFTASLLGVSSVVGRFILGWLLDNLQGSYIAVASLLAAGAGMLLLSHASTFSAAAPAAFIAGLGAGCELDLIPYMLRRYFGLRSFSTLYGLVYTFFAVAGAVAPLTTAVLSSVDARHTGSASGFNSAVARTGGLVATALLGTVLAASGPALIAGFRLAAATCAAASLAAGASAFLLIAKRR